MAIPTTILEIDIKSVLTRIEEKYHVKLPRNVIALDYGKRGDLYIRFKHVEKPLGEPTHDGNVIFFSGNGDRIVALEILDLGSIS